MSRYRQQLPQLVGGLFLTDAGIETTLIFQDGQDLPYFAAFHLLKDAAGRAVLARYYARHIAVAREHGLGFVLESATWRANPDWGTKLGYTPDALEEANRQAVKLLQELREQYSTAATPMPISGCIGPRRDGYRADTAMTSLEAEHYHEGQIRIFDQTGVDLVTAITMTNTEEAVGITRAAQRVKLPVVISFTVETDGRLPTGQRLEEAIRAVDTATDGGPAYFMINCAHPTHFEHQLEDGASWVTRIHGVRANASARSHAELDEATELDSGDPAALGAQYADLRRRFPHLNVLGGCCGTDERHIASIAATVRE
jgi:S-methylmethionine-dependent homocysteine/selenocysteine methylase